MGRIERLFRFQGSPSAGFLWKLREGTHLMDEFSYEDDDVKCFCDLRASCRISRTEANLNRKFFGCPLYCSTLKDARGCNFFLWCDIKVQEDVRKLTSLVGDLSLHLREIQREKKELESTLDRVMKHSHDVCSSSYNVRMSESEIVHEITTLKARLSRLEDIVFTRR
ncbi:hypothetical protein LINPERPRIM_LOCUS30461 [Linum perenne]